MVKSSQTYYRSAGTTDGAGSGAPKTIPVTPPLSMRDFAVLHFDRIVNHLASGVNLSTCIETSNDGLTWTVAGTMDTTTSTGWTYGDWFNADTKGFLRLGVQAWNTSGSESLPFDVGFLATYRDAGARVPS